MQRPIISTLDDPKILKAISLEVPCPTSSIHEVVKERGAEERKRKRRGRRGRRNGKMGKMGKMGKKKREGEEEGERGRTKTPT